MAKNDVVILCAKKIVRIITPEGEVVTIYGDKKLGSPKIINLMKTLKYSRQMKTHFLAYVIDTRIAKPSTSNVDIVAEFSNGFLGLPPDREVEFHVDLVPDATPVAKAPYQLAPT